LIIIITEDSIIIITKDSIIIITAVSLRVTDRLTLIAPSIVTKVEIIISIIGLPTTIIDLTANEGIKNRTNYISALI
jgi:hypothetical protein